ncbi:MAG: PDZ domain-containing protein [Myxococcales bacterium]|nr:MAG: PDZ domain-containing protein [Myxococcales bacterium]
MRALKRSFHLLGSAALVAAAFVAIGYLSAGEGAQAGPTRIWKDANPADRPAVAFQFNDVMSKLVEGTLPAVVSIATSSDVSLRRFGPQGDRMEDFFDFFFGPQSPYGEHFRQQGVGSGFIINAEGHVLTNNHVVERADEIAVQMGDGEEYPAKVIGRDPATDVALLKIEAGKPLPFLRLGDSDELKIGQMVVAMGNPLGLSHTVTMGIVSQKGRKDINPSGRKIIANFIQTDASINPGNSGGPLLNIYGEVVGINTAIAQGQGIGFAIPVNMAKTLLPQLLLGKVERSWIGIRIQDVTKELADSLNLPSPHGALIAAVVDGSPADKAGLKPEDVILEFDGKEIKSGNDLTWLASTAGIDKAVVLTVWRDGARKTFPLVLGRMPGETVAAQGEMQGGKAVIGITLVDPDKDMLKQLGITDGKGALVGDLDPNLPAARAGLKPGDVIRKINSALVRDADHAAKLLGGFKKGQTVRLFVNREQMALFIAFRV